MKRRDISLAMTMAASLAFAACGGPAQPIAAPPASATGAAVQSPTATLASATATPMPRLSPTPAFAGTAAELSGEFVDPCTLDEFYRLELEMRRLAGVTGLWGNESAVTVAYDPGHITSEQLREALGQLGHPIR